MPISELNAELAKAGPHAPATPDDWLGVDGPFELDVKLDRGTLHLSVSGHGGLQLTTGRQALGLNFIQADVAPQPLGADEAHRLAERLCVEAREAGLTMETEPSTGPSLHRSEGAEPGCYVRDQQQTLGVWVDRFQLEDNGRYRVLLNVALLDRH